MQNIKKLKILNKQEIQTIWGKHITNNSVFSANSMKNTYKDEVEFFKKLNKEINLENPNRKTTVFKELFKYILLNDTNKNEKESFLFMIRKYRRDPNIHLNVNLNLIDNNIDLLKELNNLESQDQIIIEIIDSFKKTDNNRKKTKENKSVIKFIKNISTFMINSSNKKLDTPKEIRIDL